MASRIVLFSLADYLFSAEKLVLVGVDIVHC